MSYGDNLLLAELVHMKSKLAFEVRCFILRDGLFSSELVKHLGNFNQNFCSSCSVGHLAKIAHGIASSLGIVAVAEATRLCLTDSFD